jgi:nicotinate-nucleotide adenylyltransferase
VNNRQPERIGLYGGTFDPVHLGHIHVADECRRALDLDVVRFLPCHVSPHKLGLGAAPPERRAEMLRLAVDGLPWAVVDEFDLERPQPAYSVETAEEMRRRFPGAGLFWIMGTDQWEALPRWREPERLRELLEFAVFIRGTRPEPRGGWRLHVVEGAHPASSTQVRAELLSSGSSASLDPAVAEYIRRHRLYRPA